MDQWSYNHCGLCGHQPSGTLTDPMNHAAKRWWDCDDGAVAPRMSCTQGVRDVTATATNGETR